MKHDQKASWILLLVEWRWRWQLTLRWHLPLQSVLLLSPPPVPAMTPFTWQEREVSETFQLQAPQKSSNCSLTINENRILNEVLHHSYSSLFECMAAFSYYCVIIQSSFSDSIETVIKSFPIPRRCNRYNQHTVQIFFMFFFMFSWRLNQLCKKHLYLHAMLNSELYKTQESKTELYFVGKFDALL